MSTCLNTILLPDKKFIDKMVKTARQISQGHDMEYFIDNKNYFANITLFSSKYPNENIDKVISEVNKLSKTIKQFHLVVKNFFEGKRYVMVNFQKSQTIEKIHQQMLRSLINNYQPHLSLCKFKNQQLATLATKKFNQHLKHQKITIEKIAVSKTGPNGTCTKILAEFDLEGPEIV